VGASDADLARLRGAYNRVPEGATALARTVP